MALCDSCSYRADTWSKELMEQGYNGCKILLIPSINLEGQIDDDQDWFDHIDIDQIGFGWIKIGGMCYNDCPIVRDVKKCKLYDKRI